MSSQCIISPDLIQSECHHRLFTHVQLEYHFPSCESIYSQYTTSSAQVPSQYPSLQPMASLYSISTTNVQTIPHCIQDMYSHKHHVQRLCHLYSTTQELLDPIFAAPLLPMSIQCTISTAHFQLEYQLSCPRPVSRRCLLPIASENPTTPVYVKSTHHLSCRCPVRMSPKAVCLCPIRILSFPTLVHSEMEYILRR